MEEMELPNILRLWDRGTIGSGRCGDELWQELGVGWRLCSWTFVPVGLFESLGTHVSNMSVVEAMKPSKTKAHTESICLT